jgi:glucosamine kinase
MTPVEAMTGPLLESTVARLQGLDLHQLHVVGAGMTGFHAGTTDADQVLSAWRSVWVRRLMLADDAVTSYLGALGARHDAVVAAGTGVMVLASDGEELAHVNGWVPPSGTRAVATGSVSTGSDRLRCIGCGQDRGRLDR